MSEQVQTEGIVLSTTGKTRYVKVEYVFELDQRGRWSPYCAVGDWPTSDAAREARRLSRIAELEAELAQLKAELEAKLAQRKQVSPRPTAVPEPTVVTPTPTAPKELVPCTYCGKEFTAGRGVLVHQSKCNYRERRAVSAPLAAVAPAAIVLEREWRCAECQTNTFAADLNDSQRCVRCTGVYTAALSRVS